MDRNRLRGNVPPAFEAWLEPAPDHVWDTVGREFIVRLALELLANEGELGTDPMWSRRPLSAAAKSVGGSLPQGRRWTANLVVPACAHWLGIHSGVDLLTRQVRQRLAGVGGVISQKAA